MTNKKRIEELEKEIERLKRTSPINFGYLPERYKRFTFLKSDSSDSYNYLFQNDDEDYEAILNNFVFPNDDLQEIKNYRKWNQAFIKLVRAIARENGNWYFKIKSEGTVAYFFNITNETCITIDSWCFCEKTKVVAPSFLFMRNADIANRILDTYKAEILTVFNGYLPW